MREGQFQDRLCEILRKGLPDTYNVETRKSILYKVIVDSCGKYDPVEATDPKRGHLAFQTDILISNDKVPLVVIETKIGGFSTHDVLTYSAKALKHKEVYPYLRYGFIVLGKNKIDRKFFVHNSGFDFAVAIKSDCALENLIEIVREQIESAEVMLEVLSGKGIKRYITIIKPEWATKE